MAGVGSYSLGIPTTFQVASAHDLLAGTGVTPPPVSHGAGLTIPTTSRHSKPSDFNLGIDYSKLSNGSAIPGKEPLPTWLEFMQSGGAKPEKTIGQLYTEIPHHKGLHMVVTAAEIGEGVHEIGKAIEQSGKDGISKLEAAACKAAGQATKIGLNVTAGAIIGGGVLPYVAACAEVPPLAVTIPAVAAVVPEAFGNAEKIADFAGMKIEEACQKLFSGQ